MSSHLKGPNEGQWSVFAEKVVAERDAARADLATMRNAWSEADEKLEALRVEVAELKERIKSGMATHNEARVSADTMWRERDAARAEVAELKAIGDVKLDAMVGLNTERDELLAAVKVMHNGLTAMLSVCRCGNDCPPDDTTCATRVAEAALAAGAKYLK